MFGHARPSFASTRTGVRRADRLTLAPLCEVDAEAVVAIGDDPDIAWGLTYFPSPITVSDAVVWIRGLRRNGARAFAARLHANNVFVGVGAVKPDGNDAEISYWIGRDFRRRGYGSELVRALITDIESQHRFQQVVATVRSDNVASANLLRRLSFTAGSIATRTIPPDGNQVAFKTFSCPVRTPDD